MRNVYLLAMLVLCFGCEQPESALEELSSQVDKQEEVKTRSNSFSASMSGGNLSITWSNPFVCSSAITILSVMHLETGGAAICYPFSSTGTHSFNEYDVAGTYLISAKCACGNHSLTDTYFFSPSGEVIVNPQDKCKHDFSNFSNYMPNEFYLLPNSGAIGFRFWFSSEFVLGIRPTISDDFTQASSKDEVRYRIRPTVMSSYSELEFMLPSNANEYHKAWEVRIYSTACFVGNTINFKRTSCNNYLTFKFSYDPVHGESGPSYDRPSRILFTEVKQK